MAAYVGELFLKVRGLFLIYVRLSFQAVGAPFLTFGGGRRIANCAFQAFGAKLRPNTERGRDSQQGRRGVKI